MGCISLSILARIHQVSQRSEMRVSATGRPTWPSVKGSEHLLNWNQNGLICNMSNRERERWQWQFTSLHCYCMHVRNAYLHASSTHLHGTVAMSTIKLSIGSMMLCCCICGHITKSIVSIMHVLICAQAWTH